MNCNNIYKNYYISNVYRSINKVVRTRPLECAIVSLVTAAAISAAYSAYKSCTTPKVTTYPPTTELNLLKPPESQIEQGQGEYVVFYPTSTNPQAPSKETYDQAYAILNRYSPAAIISGSNPLKAMQYCDMRYEKIKTEIKTLDPRLEVIFIPRTLYELIFIRECILEDTNNKSLCKFNKKTMHDLTHNTCPGTPELNQKYLFECSEGRAKRHCWHLCCFENQEGGDDHPGVKEVAYRLNSVMIQTLIPISDGFTHSQFALMADREIEFLKEHRNKCLDDITSLPVFQCLTTNFYYLEPTNGHDRCYPTFPMGIRNEQDSGIIQKALALDCSKAAQRAFILYRGSILKNDKVDASLQRCQSLSYGTSIFAGCVYDPDATPFYYMRTTESSHAIAIPYNQLKQSPFFIPRTNTISQLFGHGEFFHARSKVWKDTSKIMGIWGSNSQFFILPQYLRSDRTKEELIADFEHYKNQAILLKSSE